MPYRDRLSLAQVSKKFHLLSFEMEFEFISLDSEIIRFLTMKIIQFNDDKIAPIRIMYNKYHMIKTLIESDAFWYLLTDKAALNSHSAKIGFIIRFLTCFNLPKNQSKAFKLVRQKYTHHMIMAMFSILAKIPIDANIHQVYLNYLKLWEDFIIQHHEDYFRIFIGLNVSRDVNDQLLNFLLDSGKMVNNVIVIPGNGSDDESDDSNDNNSDDDEVEYELDIMEDSDEDSGMEN
jgi:hypothetical protein